MHTIARKPMTIIVAGLLTLSIAACRSDPTTPAAGQAAIVYGDCSSFRAVSADYLPEMLTFAQAAARAQMTLRYACVDGAPLRSVRFEKTDFADIPDQLKPNAGMVERFNQARALGLRDKFRRMLTRESTYPGSGQLEALELAARTPNLATVAFWTDAISNAVEDVDNLDQATKADIQAVIKRWIPRMGTGLRGTTVYFVGVGRNTASSTSLRNAETLFRGVIEGAGGTLLWRENLPNVSEGV